MFVGCQSVGVGDWFQEVFVSTAVPLSANLAEIDARLIRLHDVDTPRHGGSTSNTKANQSISADNDIDAVLIWLKECRDAPHTQRTYRKEAERFLRWCFLSGHSIKDVKREDFDAYEQFLKAPSPPEWWIVQPSREGAKPRSLPRRHENWRPFTGPLSKASVRQAKTILNGLMNYLVEAGYLDGNPLALSRKRNGGGRKQRIERYLPRPQWEYLLRYLESLPREPRREEQRYERLRWAIHFFYFTGCRIAEAADGRMGSFFKRFDNDSGKYLWYWVVTGKGDKEAEIPMNGELVNAMKRYRSYLGHPSLPTRSDELPIIPSLSGKESIGATALHTILKKFFRDAGTQMAKIDPEAGEHMKSASAHWLRHTSATHQVDAGIDIRDVSKNLRHSKLETTMIYQHSDDAKRHREMEKLTIGGGGNSSDRDNNGKEK